MDIACRRSEHSMSRLAHSQLISRPFEGRRERLLIVRCSERDQHVNDRLRRQSGHRGGTDVLDASDALAERVLDPSSFTLEADWPAGVVLDEHDRPLFPTTDENTLEVGLPLPSLGTLTACTRLPGAFVHPPAPLDPQIAWRLGL